MDIIDAACYLVNRLPHTKLDGGILKEILSKMKVEQSHLRVFGCMAYVQVDAGERSKLDARSRKMVFISYTH